MCVCACARLCFRDFRRLSCDSRPTRTSERATPGAGVSPLNACPLGLSPPPFPPRAQFDRDRDMDRTALGALKAKAAAAGRELPQVVFEKNLLQI